VEAALVLVGLALPGRPEPALRLRREDLLMAVGMLVAVAAGIMLEGRVIKGSPVPGNDWAKYVLYADEVRRHGSLLLDNPFWSIVVPFREDPGVPAIYGSYLVLGGQSATVLVHGIWVFAVIAILTTFVFVRSLWGPAAGVVAALLWAVLPISQDILGWHGLPNLAALSVLLLVLLYSGCLFAGDRLPPPETSGCG